MNFHRFTKCRDKMKKGGKLKFQNNKTGIKYYLTFGRQTSLLLLSVLLLSVIGTGCKKFLNKEILGNYPETEFYQTQEQAIQAINAAYQPLAFSTAQNRLWVFGDVASDDADEGGNPGDQADIGLIDDFDITTINGNLGNEWSLLYEGITRANLVLDKVPPIDMDESLKSRILGEAKFL